MIITNLTGGLGNQMFQYALGRHLAIKNKAELKLHFTNALFSTQRSFDLDCFNIDAMFASDRDLSKLGISNKRIVNRLAYLLDQRFRIRINRSIITEKRPTFDKNILKLSGDIYLQGYWQSEYYFKDVADQIRSDFKFVKKISKKNEAIVRLIRHSNSVSLHIRRGDYVTDSSVKKIFTSMNSLYYKRAMNIIERKVKSPHFFIFSDDIKWAKENIKSKYKILFIKHNKGKYSYEDMRLMSLCRNNIIANSSFSWWGAWLNKNNDKIIISPRKWSSTELGRDLLLKNWIKT